MRYLLLFILAYIPTLVVFIKWPKRCKDFAMPFMLVPLMVAGIISLIMATASLGIAYDTEIHNGKVTEKKPIKQDCPKGWTDWPDVFCDHYTTRRVLDYIEEVCEKDEHGNKSCHDVKHYKTQYNYDFEWERKYFVYSTLKNYEIDRIDNQGVKTPPRFTETIVGEPVAIHSRYQNYLLLADQSIINPALLTLPETVMANLPDYPNNIYDYWRVNRFVTINSVQDHNAWNTKLSEINSRLGPKKQANVILVVTTERQHVRDELFRKWNGGKKNDIIILFGIDKDTSTIDWSDAIMFLNNTGNEYLAAGLREFTGKTLEVKMLDDIEIMIDERFNREPMERIEFIKDNYQLPMRYWAIAFVFAFILSAGGTLFIFKDLE